MRSASSTSSVRARVRAEIDDAVARGEDPGPWAGVPMGVKELAKVAGWPDTHASRALPRPDRDRATAPKPARLRGGGRGARRAHDVTRVRVDELDPLVPARHHPQSVEPRAHARRFVGRFGAAAVAVGHDADLHGQRRRRLDPHPVVVLRPVRFQGLVRPGRQRRSVRQLAHVGARPDLPLGARCGALRRRDRRSDGRSTRRRCRAPCAATKTRCVPVRRSKRLRGKKAAWSSTLGFAVCDPEVEKLAHEAALALAADAGLELVDVDVQLPEARDARGASSPVSKCRATTAKRRAVGCRRHHAGVARRLRADRTA